MRKKFILDSCQIDQSIEFLQVECKKSVDSALLNRALMFIVIDCDLYRPLTAIFS